MFLTDSLAYLAQGKGQGKGHYSLRGRETYCREVPAF